MLLANAASLSTRLFFMENPGVSVATYVARRAALNGTSGNGSQPGPAGVILQSGFASLRRIAVEHYPFLGIYPQSLFPQPALDNLSILSSWEHKVPLLFIHGDRDI